MGCPGTCPTLDACPKGPSIGPPKKKICHARITHVIFDLDGLVLDTESIHADVFTEIATKHNKTFSNELKGKMIGTKEETSVGLFLKELGLEKEYTVEKFLKEFKEKSNPKLENVNLMPGAEKLIKHFQTFKIPIAVASSTNKEAYDIKTKKHTELFKAFNHIVLAGSDPEVKEGKPAPDVFKVCAERFPNKPKNHECLVLEDAPNGVEAALAAGMQCVLIPDKTLPDNLKEKATEVYESLIEFRPELFGLPPVF